MSTLDEQIGSAIARGYRVEHRTDSTACLIRSKRFNSREAVLLVLFCLGAVLLLDSLGVLVAILVVLLDLVWYAARSDERMTLRADTMGPGVPDGESAIQEFSRTVREDVGIAASSLARTVRREQP